MEEEKESPLLVGKAAIKSYEEKIGKIRDVMKWEVQEMNKPHQKKKKKSVFWQSNLDGMLRLNEQLGRGIGMKALKKSL